MFRVRSARNTGKFFDGDLFQLRSIDLELKQTQTQKQSEEKMSNKELALLDNNAVANLNAVLEGLVKSGEVKVSDLNPSLNALLTDAAQGGFAGRAFAGKVVGYRKAVPMPSFDDKDDMVDVDVLELQDVSGRFLGQTFNFYGRNGGQKAKIAGVAEKKCVVIAFKGEVESENKNHNPWKDFLVLGCDKEEIAKTTLNAIQKAVGRGEQEPVKVGAKA